MGTEYEMLLYYREFRWFSRAQVLKRLYELMAEDSLFLKYKETPLLERLEGNNCIFGSVYLTDISNHRNEVNLSI
jgi:hypothetical protein